jgi:hypothetical protein
MVLNSRANLRKGQRWLPRLPFTQALALRLWYVPMTLKADTQISLGYPKFILQISLLVFFLLLFTSFFAGVSLTDSVRVSAVITSQTWLGLLICSFVLPPGSSRIEALGISLCLGTLGAALISSTLPPQLQALWFLPGLLSIIVLTVLRRGERIAVTRSPLHAAILALITIGLIAQWYFWRENPLEWSGWWQHYSDIYFHEGIGKSIEFGGLNQLNWLQGYGIGYHWFADAWIGDLNSAAQTGHFAVASRVILTVSIVGCACLAWAWAEKLSSRRLAPIFSSGLVLIAGLTGAGLRNTYGVIGALYSPTHSFALMSLLALSLVVLQSANRRLSFAYCLAVGLLGVGAGGGRITQVVVLLGATCALLLNLGLHKRVSRHWILILISMWVGVVIGLALAIRPWARIIRNNKFLIEPNTQFGAMLGFVPDNSSIGNTASVIAVLFSVGAGWAGLLWFIRCRFMPDSVAWILGGAVSGFLAVFLTYQNGFSHMTFLWSASALALVGSGVGVAEVVHRARETASPMVFKRALFASLSLGLILGGLGVWISFVSPGIRFEGLIRWSIPILIWLFAILLGIALAIGFRIPWRSPLIWATAILVLTSAAVSAGLTAATLKLFQPIPTYSSSTPLALTQSQLDAADWVDANVSDSGLFVTNRFCMDPMQNPPECKSNWFLVSALAGRPTLVEGYSDGTGLDISSETPENKWLRDRVLPIIEFSNGPSSESQTTLWKQDVRWVWIDRTITNRVSWEPYATQIFENETTQILQLNPPTNPTFD